MSGPTKTPHTKKNKISESNVPWRESAKKEIKKYTEVDVMIRGGRYKIGFTQKKLAEALGILPHHVSEMEHGKRKVSPRMAKKLGKIFGVDYRVFL